MAWTLVFWRNRSTATVVPAASACQARSRVQHRHKRLWGDRGRTPCQCPGPFTDSPQRLGALPPGWLQPPVRQGAIQAPSQAAAQP
jgi:hypothetical protein